MKYEKERRAAEVMSADEGNGESGGRTAHFFILHHSYFILSDHVALRLAQTLMPNIITSAGPQRVVIQKMRSR